MSDTIHAQIRDALEYACLSQSFHAITQGREKILTLPRERVLALIELVAAETLPLEEWEYRRLLELYQLLDVHLTQRLVACGLTSADPYVRAAAVEFQSHAPDV